MNRFKIFYAKLFFIKLPIWLEIPLRLSITQTGSQFRVYLESKSHAQKADMEMRAMMEARMAAPEEKYEAADPIESPVHCMDIIMPSISNEKAASTTFWFMHL